MARRVLMVLIAAVLVGLIGAALSQPAGPPLGAHPHDVIVTSFTRAHGREDLYVRNYTYTHGFIQDQGRYSVDYGWSGNIEQQSVVVCPIRRAGDEIEARFIHDTRLEPDCPLPGNY